MAFHTTGCPPVHLVNANKIKALYKRRASPSTTVYSSSRMMGTGEIGSLPTHRKISGSSEALWRSHSPNSLLNQENTVGIIGGISVSSTLSFQEKLVKWSSKEAEVCLPFVVCSDPALNKDLLFHTSLHPSNKKTAKIQLNHASLVQNLRHKRVFLEHSGARCLVMPCHISHAWHHEISEGCSIPFFHVAECVARELKEAKLKPLQAGSSVRIGVLATEATLSAGFYQEKLQSQGFEVVLPDKATMEHIIIPAIESLNQRDMKGAQNLFWIAVQILLIRAVNAVIIALDDMRGCLPQDDPLLKKCVDPMDALARSTIKWAISKCEAT